MVTKPSFNSSSTEGTGIPILNDFMATIAQWRRFIVVNIILVTAVSLGVSFLLPRWYRASCTILPPKNQNLLSNVGFASSNIIRQINPLRSLGSTTSSPEMYNYLAILRSHTLLDRIVKVFDLTNVYDISDHSIDKTIDELLSNVSFKVNEEGTLNIEVEDHDPGRAVAMADSFAVALDEINQELSAREARGNREFIDQRLSQNVKDLRNTEDSLKIFQEKHGIIAVSEQANSEISAVAELYAQRMKQELEIGILKRALTDDNPLLQSANDRLLELNKKLQNIPALGVSYLRLYREYTIQEKLFEILVPLREQAKIEEHRDTPTLLILDKAEKPDRPYAPRKLIIVVVFFVISTVFSIGIALFSGSLHRMKTVHPVEYERLMDNWRAIWAKKKII
jgi:tyrosine-protein kinase Etk/Wzc